MYLYLYAPFLRGKNYAREIALIEGRVTDFGMTGKIAQLSQFLKFSAAVREFGLKKLKTVVLVGDDALFEEAVNEFALSNIVLSFIPMAESRYASVLAIPYGAQAVDTLAARHIVKIDLGKVEQRFFLGSLLMEGAALEIHSPTFSIFPKGRTRVEVRNLRSTGLPTGALEVRVTPIEGALFRKPGQASVVPVNSCRLKSAKSLPVRCGTVATFKTPLQVDIAGEAVRMVVGRRIRQIKNVKLKM